MRITGPTYKVLKTLLSGPDGTWYGLQIGRASGLKTGTLYPILLRLQDHGWIEGEWEDIDPSVEGRRPRRYWHLTPNGRARARAAVNEIDNFQPRPALGWEGAP